MRVPADDGFNALLPRHAQGIAGHVLIEYPVEQRPFLGVLGHVGIAPAEPDAAIVQAAEGPLKHRVPGHQAVEPMAVNHEQPPVEPPAIDKADLPRIGQLELGIVIAVHPDYRPGLRLAHEALQHGPMGVGQGLARLIYDVAVEHERHPFGQGIEPRREVAMVKVSRSEVQIADDEAVCDVHISCCIV